MRSQFLTCLSLSLSLYASEMHFETKGELLLEAGEKTETLIQNLLTQGKKGSIFPLRILEKGSPMRLIWKPVTEPHPSSTKPPARPLPLSNKKQKGMGVTYSFSGGRLGDNLMAYFHGKWIAREFGLPFLYKPFPLSETFKLDEMDQKFSQSYTFAKTARFSNKENLEKMKGSILVDVPYFSECKYEIVHSPWNHWPYFVIDWDDPLFRQEAIVALTPKNPVKTLELPANCLTIAIHVRRGGNYESFADGLKNYPLKFPPDSYYIEQLQRLAQIFEDTPIYVHLFTDDVHPEAIAEKYANAIGRKNMQFGWNSNELRQNSDLELLHDFHSMGKFDCLIRCQSHLSLIASVLGDYKVMITPLDCFFDGNDVIVDQVETQFKAQ